MWYASITLRDIDDLLKSEDLRTESCPPIADVTSTRSH